MTEPLLIANSGKEALDLLPRMTNRHGLVADATGAGKTITLQAMAEQFLDIPDVVPGQLGNRVQHALRAFTPRDQKAARVLICPPGSRTGPVTEAEREAVIRCSALYGVDEQVVDRESAYEILKARAETTAEQPAAQPDEGVDWGGLLGGQTGPHGGRGREGAVEAAAKSIARWVLNSTASSSAACWGLFLANVVRGLGRRLPAQ